MPKTSVDNEFGKVSRDTARGRKRRFVGRLAYFLGVLSLVIYVIVFPSWTGTSYMPAFDSPNAYQSNGTFGLVDSELDAPIWNPPHAHRPDLDATVRWPWQAVSGPAHIEMSTFNIAWRFAIGMVLLGLALRVWNGISARNRRDRFVDMAWSVSLGTGISILGLMIFGVFTMGFGLTDSIVVGGLSAGALSGLCYGAVTFRAQHVSRSLFSVSQLAWFAVGLAGSTVIMIVAGNLAQMFRGDPMGVIDLGASGYAGSQALIDVVTGMGIAVSGLLMSWLFAWSRMPRGLVTGMFVGALLLGALYAFSF